MDSPPDFLPTATLETLRVRAKLLATARRFFDGRGYWEVETPLLSHDGPVDPHLEPFVTRWLPSGGGREASAPVGSAGRYDPDLLLLQTSPEFGMKRLIAAGADAIYQLGRAFRNGERGTLHNPEFTMLEWYRVGDSDEDQMRVVEALVVAVFTVARETAARETASRGVGHTELSAIEVPFERTTYEVAFQRHTGADAIRMSARGLKDLAGRLGIVAPESLGDADRDTWLNLLLAECVEPALGRNGPEFLYHYPASQAALARIRAEDPPVAERFELYLEGVELCNGYCELTDPLVLRQRMAEESARRTAEGQPPLRESNRLLAAMEAGLPECGGVALGFDRLVMAALGAKSIAEVIPFPFDRA